MRMFLLSIIGRVYVWLIKPVLFMRKPEEVHEKAVSLGESMGKSPFLKAILGHFFVLCQSSLHQELFGLEFKTPIGLAAGFDYEARLTNLLPSLGFGFGTVGTLTHEAYGGNPSPMLGRLPRSRSLMVNKGFKNLGVSRTLSKFKKDPFAYPVGVSIGKTNSISITTQEEAVADVVNGFKDAEVSGAPFSYYELNISCPNLLGNIEFYEPSHLHGLLSAVAELRLSRPVFIKMPISKTDEEIRGMLEVIASYPFIKGVILGNLQRDRHHPLLHKEEVGRFSVGNFSGLPCRDRSDELIRLTYNLYGKRLTIIGCGGVFSAEDAYRKFALGASLVQLITGLIFEGPQLVARINIELANRLKRQGHANITEIIGSAVSHERIL